MFQISTKNKPAPKTKTFKVKSTFLAKSGVLILEPHGPLTSKDFEGIEMEIGPWLRTNGRLLSVVIHARTFPGWSGFAALVRHLRFVRVHRRDIRRIAKAVDGLLPTIVSKIIELYVHSETKVFGHGALPEAIEWAAKVEPKTKVERRIAREYKDDRIIPNIPGF